MLQMVQFECPKYKNPCVTSFLSEFPFLIFFPFSLTVVIRNWTSQYERQERRKILGQNQLKRLQMVQFECPKFKNPLKWYLFEVYCKCSFSSGIWCCVSPPACHSIRRTFRNRFVGVENKLPQDARTNWIRNARNHQQNKQNEKSDNFIFHDFLLRSPL